MTEIYLKGSNKEVLQQMQRSGFNVTTCGDCGEIRLLGPNVNREAIECDSCGMIDEECWFPDLVTVQG